MLWLKAQKFASGAILTQSHGYFEHSEGWVGGGGKKQEMKMQH